MFLRLIPLLVFEVSPSFGFHPSSLKVVVLALQIYFVYNHWSLKFEKELQLHLTTSYVALTLLNWLIEACLSGKLAYELVIIITKTKKKKAFTKL